MGKTKRVKTVINVEHYLNDKGELMMDITSKGGSAAHVEHAAMNIVMKMYGEMNEKRFSIQRNMATRVIQNDFNIYNEPIKSKIK